MVVLASSVCTKGGKAVLSRQYVEMSRPRIEGLLASFPKLISTGGQHTYVETEAVRYIYQPLEDLYLVLITNKQSNILQDINTLHLFARTVSEYCRSLKESEIARNAYDLICAFDEIVALGYGDSSNVAQIKTFTEMDSHEEKLQEMLQKSKEREALEKAKLKAKQLEMQKKEAAKRGFSGNSGGFGGNFGGRSSSFTSPATSPPAPNTYAAEAASMQSRSSASTVAAAPKRGMQLGAKPTKANDMLEAIRADEGIPVASMDQPLAVNVSSSGASGAASGMTSPINRVQQGPVHLSIEEKISAALNRDGGLENLEVKGELTLRISAAEKARLKVGMKVLNVDPNLQFKTHPHVDKNLWQSDWAIATKDPAKPFPLNQPTPVVKWRFVTKDESMIPLSVNVWPAPTGSGTIDCSVEYELISEKSELRDVCIMIPLPPGSGQPKIDQVDGDYTVNHSQKTLDWRIPLVDSSNSSGTLEFSVSGNDADSFFPVKVAFISPKPFCDIAIGEVISLENNAPVDFTSEVQLCTEDYSIV